jgi:hypothetical protein
VQRVQLLAMVDSGADTSAMDASYADMLGLERAHAVESEITTVGPAAPYSCSEITISLRGGEPPNASGVERVCLTCSSSSSPSTNRSREPGDSPRPSPARGNDRSLSVPVSRRLRPLRPRCHTWSRSRVADCDTGTGADVGQRCRTLPRGVTDTAQARAQPPGLVNAGD